MAKEPVFYSFHFDTDVFRVQQIRNMGVVDGNEPVSPNAWLQLQRTGDAAVKKWIDENMKYRRCVIVLIGAQTANSRWVTYEIQKAWEDRRGLFGIYIHNLRCPRTGTCSKGTNPFATWDVGSQSMANLVPCYEPNGADAYRDIARNLPDWVASAISEARRR